MPPPFTADRYRYPMLSGGLILMSATAATKLLALAFQFLLPKQYGASHMTDAYFTAQIIPVMIGTLFSVSLSTALIVNQKMAEAFSSVLPIMFGCLLVVCSALGIFSDVLISRLMHSLPADVTPLAIRFSKILAGSLGFLVLSGGLTALLYLRQQVIPVALASIMPNAGSFAGLMLSRSFGPDSICWGQLFGFAAQCIILWAATPRMDTRRSMPSARAVLGLLDSVLPVLFITSVSVSYFVIDRLATAAAPAGVLSSAAFAANLVLLPSQVIVTPACAALLPVLVKNSGNDNLLSLAFVDAIKYCLMPIIPLVAILAVASHPVVQFVLSGGAFTADAVAATASFVSLYAVALGGITLKDLCTTCLIARGVRWTPALIGILGVIMSYATKDIFVRALGWSGVAISTSVFALISGVCLLMPCNRFLAPRFWSLVRRQ